VAEQGPAIADRTPIFSLLGANGVSQVGNTVLLVAVPWFVLETTGSAARTGLAAAAIGVGAVVPVVLGGPLVDRLGFKRASVLADLTSGATVAAIPLLYLAGVLAFWQLLVLLFLLSSLNTNGDTARFSLIPALARRATMPIERANAADRSIARLGPLVGAPLAGVLIALVGASNVLFVDAVTFSVSAALVALGVPSAASADAEAEAEGARGYLSELLEGLRFVRTNTLILSMILVAMVTNFLDVPLAQVILPVYANTIYGSAPSLGVILGAFGGGIFAGTLLFGAVGHRLPRRPHLPRLLRDGAPDRLRGARHDATAGGRGGSGSSREPDRRTHKPSVCDGYPRGDPAPDAGARLRDAQCPGAGWHPAWGGTGGLRGRGGGARPDNPGHGGCLSGGDSWHVPQPGAPPDGRC
jgi:predicted MFS family arabinose efflux permease